MFVYITTNKINGKRYIGKHKGSPNDNYLGSGKRLILAIKKYGKENFERKIVYRAKSNDELDFAEKLFIRAFNAYKSPLFYNIHEGGTGGNTKAGFTDEEYEKYKEKFRGKNNPMYGVKKRNILCMENITQIKHESK